MTPDNVRMSPCEKTAGDSPRIHGEQVNETNKISSQDKAVKRVFGNKADAGVDVL